jgi:oligoendopeptidase F
MGSMIAAVISAILNHSFWWAILHFFCGFFYVIYALAFRSHELVVAFRTMFS